MRRIAIPVFATALCSLALGATSALAAAPVISSLTVSSPTTTSVTLQAKINPGGKITGYHFEYGPADCLSNPCTKVPVPDANTSNGVVPEPVSRPLSGLAPGTTYHYRLIAKNVEGTVPSPDRTFSTFPSPSSFAPCANDSFRNEHPSANLPDCRAYEQASPVDKNGTDANGNIFQVQASLSGDAITFLTNSGVPGGVGAQEFPDYLSRRVGANWSTQGVLPPPSFGEKAGVVGWTPDLAYVFDAASIAGGSGSSLLSRRSSDGQIEELVKPAPKATYAFAGASADNSKLYFEAIGAQLTPDAAPGADNLYLFDRASGKLTLAGILPDSACATPPCTPPGGSFAGPYDWWGGVLTRGGAMNDPFANGAQGYFTQEQHAISADGSKAYFTAGNTGQIYLRKGLSTPTPSSVQISASRMTEGEGKEGKDAAGTQPAAFVGATPDGASAYFTSTEKLTNDATTGPEPPPAAIARADIEGLVSDKSFLPALASAVTVDSEHIYWANPAKKAIGRAKLGATGPEEVEEEFIEGIENPQGVAVGGGHIYWTNALPEAEIEEGKGTIGRAKLGASGAEEVQPECVKGASNPQGIDVDASFVYWVNAVTRPPTVEGTVGKANNDCSGEPNQELISGSVGGDVAVGGGKIYYSRVNGAGNGFIRSVNLDGSNLQDVYPKGSPPETILTHSIEPPALALDGSHLYFTNPASSVIGRSDLDGENAKELITAAGQPKGLAVDAAHIYWSANQEIVPNAGNDLYRYEAGTNTLSDLTVDNNPADPNGAEVQGFVGASKDGSYLYLVANGDLDGPEPTGPAKLGNCKRSGSGRFDYSGECNLYLAHGGKFTLIARLDASGEGGTSDAANWQPDPAYGANFKQVSTARVSADGQTLLFRSQRKLGSFENEGTPELYRYQVGDPGPVCVSCAPSGAAARGAAALRSIVPPYVKVETQPVLTRNLSADGKRVFFESPDKLVEADTNGDVECPLIGGGFKVPACQDVYEWEAQGSGTCQSAGGCIYLLSSGTSPSPSFFGDASASGEDAFVFTRDQLVPQDKDGIQDVYDVKALGGLAAQNQPPPPPPCENEACKPAPTPPLLTPSAPSFVGPPNPKPKRQKPRHHKPKKHQKQKHHKKKQGKAHANRGAHR